MTDDEIIDLGVRYAEGELSDEAFVAAVRAVGSSANTADLPCRGACFIDDGLTQEWVSKVCESARMKGWRDPKFPDLEKARG